MAYKPEQATTWKTVTLDRPINVPGHNLAGRIQVGEPRPAPPTMNIQERTVWVKKIDLVDGCIVVSNHDGTSRVLSPSAWVWLE